MSSRQVVLGSSSRYRAELLRRVVPNFEQLSPGIDENALDGEAIASQVERLSRAKARAVASLRPHAVVIASDQLAETADGVVLGKPGDADGAAAQLGSLSARQARFLTGVCVLDAVSRVERYRLVETRVQLRSLSARDIHHYLQREQPFDCAGSFKSEGLGIALFQWVRSDDPTALVGLPLIALVALLQEVGFEVLATGAARSS